MTPPRHTRLILAFAFLPVPSGWAQDLDPALRSEPAAALAAEARRLGDPARGAIVFHQPFMACVRCHAAGDGKASPLGPDLAAIDKSASDASIVESVLLPSKEIKKGYESATVSTVGGKLVSGIVASRDDTKVVIRDPAKGGEAIVIPKADIAELAPSAQSIMPAGLVNQLSSRQQFLDLARYLMELRDGGAPRAVALRPPANLIAPEPPEYEKRIDHAGLVRSLDGKALARGEAIYRRVCANCHGTLEMAGSLPAAPRFAESTLKNGHDPFAMYQTLTRGFGLMPAQTWMVPSQKYDVIHYIREAYMRDRNAARYKAVDNQYLAGLPKGDTRGPAPSKIEPWSAMDYGPTLTHTYEIPGRERNFAHKGVAVRLDPGAGGVARGRQWMVFDEDTLRVAAVWETAAGAGSNAADAGFINWRGIQFNGEHGIHPSIAGDIRIANGTGAGWANPTTGSWDDSVRVRGRDDRLYGPLPKDWARFKGLYHHGQQAVFSYSVGDANVLESPRLLETATERKEAAFGRIFVIGPRERDLEVQIAEHPDKDARLEQAKESPGRVTLAPGIDAAAPTPEPFRFGADSHLEITDGAAFDMTDKPFTVVARVKAGGDGTLFAKAAPGPAWTPGGQALFVRDGRLVFDIGWVGAVSSRATINDGQWHVVAVIGEPSSGAIRLFIDGKPAGSGTLKARPAPEGAVARIGFAASNFPAVSRFKGDISDIRFYQRAMQARDFKAPADLPDATGVLAHWKPSDMKGELSPDHAGRKLDARVVRGQRIAGEKVSITAGVFPADAKATWKSSKGKLRLGIPAGKETVRLCVWTSSTPSRQAIASAPVITPDDLNLEALTKGGPSRWPQALETAVTPGSDEGAFATDGLAAPESNPWLAQTRFTGLDFLPDGRIALCSWDGDVWIARQDQAKIQWRRIASGMFQPLGIRHVNGAIHVTCRDQLAVLRDLNGDGETDFYQCLNNDHQVTEHFHEFAMGLQTDAQGNFYYAKSARHALPAVVPHHGTLLKVSADGSRTEIIANGFRAANGVCLNPDGSFLVTDQEGHWNPKNRINWVKPPDSQSGGKPRFYGNMFGYHDKTDPADSAMEPPLCWITNAFDRSPAELLWVNSPKWGSLNGGLLNLSYGYGKVFLVPHETPATGLPQGGMVELPIPPFPTGVMRGRFNPGDGQLYLCGMFAWAGNATKPGGFYRIRATGKPARLPVGLRATADGMELTFSEPLEPGSIVPSKAQARAWALRRSASYGSPHVNEHPLPVKEASLSADGRTVRLRLGGMAPTWCMEISYSFTAADGKPVTGTIHNTVHAPGK